MMEIWTRARSVSRGKQTPPTPPLMLPPSLAWIADRLDALERSHLRRDVVARDGAPLTELRRNNRSYANFASNDYLGLAADPRLQAAAGAAIEQYGWGAGASPLIVGYTGLQAQLEQSLAQFEGTEAALVFGSGYAANVGTITALVDREDAIFSDELNHASIVDGCRLSRAAVHVYSHGDVATLAELLKHVPARRRLIVTDSLFSMHGDMAPLADLAELAEQHQAMLMVDEAHATGIFGPAGRGLCEAVGVEDVVAIRLGTLSKALGCSGGFVAGSRELIDWLVNRARTYIFSTALPPTNAAAAMAALKIVQEEPWRREKLLQTAQTLANELRGHGWNLGESASQILPLVVGASERALQLAAWLKELGFWIPAIRPPSVRPGEACLRISLSANHAPETIALLRDTLVRVHDRRE